MTPFRGTSPLFAVLLFTIPACMGQQRGEHGTEAGDMAYTELGEETLPAVDPSEVTVFRKGESLPVGLKRVGGYYKHGSHPEDYIASDGDYPSKADPHRVVGRVGVVLGKGVNEKTALARIVNAAAKHGANGVVLVSEGRRAFIGAAVRISDAPVDPPLPNAASVLKSPPEGASDFSKLGKPHERQLQAFEPVTFSAKPLHCYGMHLALDEDAMLSAAALKHLQAVPKGLERGTMGFQLTDGARVRDRSFFVELGCSRAASEGKLARLQAMAAKKDAGDGAVSIQLYERASSDKEIAERIAAHEKKVKSQQAAHDAAGREVARKACQRCLSVRLTQCRDGNPQGCSAYKSCLDRSAVRVHECP